MIETLLILVATFAVMMVAFCMIEKCLKKRKKTFSQPENHNESYKAFLKFYMPSGWYCEFWKNDVMCFGVLDVEQEKHCSGEKLEVKVKGFSDEYELELA